MTKTCCRCHQEQPCTMFRKRKASRDGLDSWCKGCRQQHYIANRDKMIAAVVASAKKNPEKLRARRNRWQRENMDAQRAKYRARDAVRRAIKSGKLIRPNSCQKCGTYAKVEAHHADYANPLQVQWICRRCHGAEHRLVGVAA